MENSEDEVSVDGAAEATTDDDADGKWDPEIAAFDDNIRRDVVEALYQLGLEADWIKGLFDYYEVPEAKVERDLNKAKRKPLREPEGGWYEHQLLALAACLTEESYGGLTGDGVRLLTGALEDLLDQRDITIFLEGALEMICSFNDMTLNGDSDQVFETWCIFLGALINTKRKQHKPLGITSLDVLKPTLVLYVKTNAKKLGEESLDAPTVVSAAVTMG